MVNEAPNAVWLCPTCGSPSVDKSPLIGTNSKCRVCKWEGPVSDLVAQSVSSDILPADVIQLLHNDVRQILGENAPRFIQTLVKCRVVQAGNRDEILIMLNKIGQSILYGVVEGAEELEKRRYAAQKLFS